MSWDGYASAALATLAGFADGESDAEIEGAVQADRAVVSIIDNPPCALYVQR